MDITSTKGIDECKAFSINNCHKLPCFGVGVFFSININKLTAACHFWFGATCADKEEESAKLTYKAARETVCTRVFSRSTVDMSLGSGAEV